MKKMKTKKKMALRHYHDLNRLFNQAKYLCMKEMLPPKEEFVSNYPLSTIGIVSVKKFWEECRELGIVQHPFYTREEDFSSFEKALHEICCQYMYSDEEGSTTETVRKQIQNLFAKYNIQY